MTQPEFIQTLLKIYKANWKAGKKERVIGQTVRLGTDAQKRLNSGKFIL